MNDTDPDTRTQPAWSRVPPWVVVVIFVILSGWALKAMAAVAVPVLFAILVTVVMAPLDDKLRRALPDKLKWLAHAVVMLILLAILAAFVGALIFAAERILQEMPRVSDQIATIMPPEGGGAAAAAAEAGGNALGPQLRSLWNNASGSVGSWLVGNVTALAQTTATMTGAFVTAIVIVFFMVLLALTEIGLWRGKVVALWPGHAEAAWWDTMSTIALRLRQFLVVRTAVGIFQGALYVGWLAIFGIDLLFVWGTITFILTYIPTLGSIVAGVLPVLYTLLVADWWTALAVASGLFVIEQVVGNYVDPKVLGKRIVLSPLIILIALMFWGWLWGAAGAFLATPITLSLLVIFNHIPALRPVALMLSNQPDHKKLDQKLDVRAESG